MESAANASSAPNAQGPNGTSGTKNGRNRKMYAILILCGVVGLIFGVKWTVFRMHYTATEDAQVDADILPISAKSPGRILRIIVSEGDKVQRGQLLAEIDSTDYKLSLERARAGLEASRRELDKAASALILSRSRTRLGILTSESTLTQAQSGVDISSTQQRVNLSRLRKEAERAEVNRKRVLERRGELGAMADQAGADVDRAEKLFASGVVSKAQLDQARTNAGVAADRLAQADQELADAEKLVELTHSNLNAAAIDSTQIKIAEQNREKAGLSLDLSRRQSEEVRSAENNVRALRARVRDMRAAVQQARVALAETRVLSPVDGVVAKKTSQPFEIVPAGKPIVFILDTKRLWITANIEEIFLGKIRIGARARVEIDALPDKSFKGRVYSIGNATNAKFSIIPQSNPSGQFIKVTQRIPVKIRLDGDTAGLRPGMNAVVTIKNK